MVDYDMEPYSMVCGEFPFSRGSEVSVVSMKSLSGLLALACCLLQPAVVQLISLLVLWGLFRFKSTEKRITFRTLNPKP